MRIPCQGSMYVSVRVMCVWRPDGDVWCPPLPHWILSSEPGSSPMSSGAQLLSPSPQDWDLWGSSLYPAATMRSSPHVWFSPWSQFLSTLPTWSFCSPECPESAQLPRSLSGAHWAHLWADGKMDLLFAICNRSSIIHMLPQFFSHLY